MARRWLVVALVAGMLCGARAEAVDPLPGENDAFAPLPPDPFPDRMSAFVWRNWGLVDAGRLASAVGATAEDLAAIAVEMGLPSAPEVLPEWRRRGYITIVRRNWHLLPYDQLLTVLDMTRVELAFSLKEDDFLWVKLGRRKPKCERLSFDRAAVVRTRAARLELARRLREAGFDPAADETPRFGFVKDLSSVDPAFVKPVENADSPFGFRLIFSYFADYGDPLADPEVKSYPEGLLQKLAAEGVNAVWLHTALRTLAKDGKYPEFGEGCEMRIAHLRKLVARAARYGIKVFLYMNEPRGMPEEFFRADPARQAFKGVAEGPYFSMCTTASPEPLRWVRDALAKVFSAVPGLGGIFTITMSENLTHCCSRARRLNCPRCKDRSIGEIVAEVNRAMIEGMRRGNPEAEAVVWDWAWPIDEREAIVKGLPARNCRLMAVSENKMIVDRGGGKIPESDYSISVVGPGDAARGFWSLARRRGIPAVAKVQAANSWELSSFPYLPVIDLVAEHAFNLKQEGIDGVMLSWSLGCHPSPNIAVFRDIRKSDSDKMAVERRLAESLYGAAAAEAVLGAWRAYADGFREYPFCIPTIYKGPQHWGPANPLYLKPTKWPATMVGIPYDDLKGWRASYPADVWIGRMDRIAKGFGEGNRLFAAAIPSMPADRRMAAERELGMFRAETLHFASVADQARFVLARDAGDRAAMREIAARELSRVKEILPLVRDDPRFGYESSNHYFYVPRDLLEKALTCFAVRDCP